MKIGPFEVRGELGRGGAGIVYRAESPTGDAVAVKVLASSRDGEKIARFERERRLQGALGEAEGFVPLLDSGTSPAGPYFVMPLVGGGTLRARLARGPLDVAATVALGEALARALGRAHALGIVHRDLKPENVLFTDDGRPLVADLGLAKHFLGDTPGASRSVLLSRSNEARGTAGYMAPEQMNDARSVGPDADVFALGAVLYECLAGKPAFEGETVLEVFTRVASGKTPPLASACPEAPAWLRAVIERSLALEPGDRFADGARFLEALTAGGTRRRRGGARLVLALVAAVAVAGVVRWKTAEAPLSVRASVEESALDRQARLRRGDARPGELVSLTTTPQGRELLRVLAQDAVIFPWSAVEPGVSARSVDLRVLESIAGVASATTPAERARCISALQEAHPKGDAAYLVAAAAGIDHVVAGFDGMQRRDPGDEIQTLLAPLEGKPQLIAVAVASLASVCRADLTFWYVQHHRAPDALPMSMKRVTSLEGALDLVAPEVAVDYIMRTETWSAPYGRVGARTPEVNAARRAALERQTLRLEARGDHLVALVAWMGLIDLCFISRLVDPRDVADLDRYIERASPCLAGVGTDGEWAVEAPLFRWNMAHVAARGLMMAAGGLARDRLERALAGAREALAAENAFSRMPGDLEDDADRVAAMLVALGRSGEVAAVKGLAEDDPLRVLAREPFDLAALEAAAARAAASPRPCVRGAGGCIEVGIAEARGAPTDELLREVGRTGYGPVPIVVKATRRRIEAARGR